MGLKIKYDTTKVDRSKSVGIPPNPGVYLMTIKEVKHHPEKDGKAARLEFVVRVKGGDHKGYGFWDYVALAESSAWKLDQYLIAIGVDTEKKSKGTIDLDTFLNKDVMGRVKHDTYEGEYRPKLAAVLAVIGDDDDDDDDEDFEEDDEVDEVDEDDDDDEDDEEDDSDDDDDEDEDDDEDDDEEDEDDEEEEPEPTPPPKKKKTAKKRAYDDMELEELKAEASSRGLVAKGSKSALIARLRANDDDPFSDD